MPTDELEHELRRAFASAADGYPNPDQARQRLLDRDYHTGSEHRRLIATVTAVASAGSAALALSLVGLLSANHSHSTTTTPTTANARTDRISAFTLISNDNGTETLTLRLARMLDPAALQQALKQHGIPALVKTNTYCVSHPAASDPTSNGVILTRLPDKAHSLVPAPHGAAPNAVKGLFARTKTVINPAKIPSGTELFFDYSSNHQALYVGLIHTHSYTCTAGLPPKGQ